MIYISPTDDDDDGCSLPAYNIHVLAEWVEELDPSQELWKPNNLDRLYLHYFIFTPLFGFVSIIILSYCLLINKVKTAIANMGKILKKIINNT